MFRARAFLETLKSGTSHPFPAPAMTASASLPLVSLSLKTKERAQSIFSMISCLRSSLGSPVPRAPALRKPRAPDMLDAAVFACSLAARRAFRSSRFMDTMVAAFFFASSLAHLSSCFSSSAMASLKASTAPRASPRP